VTRQLVRPASCFCVFEKTNSERKNIMQGDYYNPCDIEALEILRPASDYLLQMAASGQIDLNNLARLEFRARRRHEAAQRIAADHFHAEFNAGVP
jgi:hypothetical protein